jgi:cytochrome oxidase assembly protein ShyY1
MLKTAGNACAYLLTGWFILAFSLIVFAGIYFAGVVIYYLLR